MDALIKGRDEFEQGATLPLAVPAPGLQTAKDAWEIGAFLSVKRDNTWRWNVFLLPFALLLVGKLKQWQSRGRRAVYPCHRERTQATLSTSPMSQPTLVSGPAHAAEVGTWRPGKLGSRSFPAAGPRVSECLPRA